MDSDTVLTFHRIFNPAGASVPEDSEGMVLRNA